MFAASDEDAGARQLCEPANGAPARARLPLPTDPQIVLVCADESIACVDGVIRACRGPGLPTEVLAVCLDGCAAGIGLSPGDAPPVRWYTGIGAAAILCRGDQTERR